VLAIMIMEGKWLLPQVYLASHNLEVQSVACKHHNDARQPDFGTVIIRVESSTVKHVKLIALNFEKQKDVEEKNL